MDDYARTLHMIALRNIQDDNMPSHFVCSELAFTLEDEGDKYPYGAFNNDIFHHFTSLFDRVHWTKSGKKFMCGSDGAWWEDGWQEPRVRALECLLRD